MSIIDLLLHDNRDSRICEVKLIVSRYRCELLLCACEDDTELPVCRLFNFVRHCLSADLAADLDGLDEEGIVAKIGYFCIQLFIMGSARIY